MNLTDTGGLWAVIVFKAQNNNLTSQDLPHNITYKLRYFALGYISHLLTQYGQLENR
jgi:YD repeat-containing protein